MCALTLIDLVAFSSKEMMKSGESFGSKSTVTVISFAAYEPFLTVTVKKKSADCAFVSEV